MIPSLVEDLPKLGDWTIVCSRLYTPMERRRLVYGGNVLPVARINPRTIQATFLNKIMAGQIFQSVNDWEDLQRRLRASGYSDDLSLLQEKLAMANTMQQYVDQIQEPTETTTTTTATATATLPTTPSTGRKRTITDCHENDNHQDNLDQNTLPDHENRNKKMKQTLRERMAMRAGHLWLRDETFLAAKIQQLKEYTLAFDEARRYPSPDAFAQIKTPRFWDPGHVAAAAAGATIIPQDNETQQETNQLSPLAAAAAGLDPLVDRNVMERAIHSALTNYHATSRNINRTLDWPSMDWSNRKNAPPPSKAVATNPIALATSTFTTTTSTTTVAPSPPSLVDTRKSVPAAFLRKESLDPLPMNLATSGNNPIMAPDWEKNLDMVGGTTTTSTSTTSTTVNNMALEGIDDQLPECQEKPVVDSENRPITDSPRNEQEVVVNQPLEMANDSIVVAVPTDPKEASLPVMDDGSLHNQDQPEAESTSMTIPVQEDDETAVMLPHVPNPYQGQFRFIMIRMAVWSIVLHALLWTWLEATDDRLDNNPLRICLSMETLGRPTRSHYSSSLATMADSNPHYGPWLGSSEDDDATNASLPGMSSLAKTASGMYLHRLCTPWYGVMNLTLGVFLVSVWLVSRLSFKK